MLNIGTTAEAIATALLQHKRLRVVTNNLNVTKLLCSNTDCEVIVAGGVAHAIMAHAREVWLAADSSKFNRPAMVQVATLPQIDRLFTEEQPPDPFPALWAEAKVRCDIATP